MSLPVNIPQNMENNRGLDGDSMDEVYTILDADLDSFTVWVGDEIHASCKFCDYRFSFSPVVSLQKLVMAAREHDCDEYREQLVEAQKQRKLVAAERARAEANAQLERDKGKSMGKARRPSHTDGDTKGGFN